MALWAAGGSHHWGGGSETKRDESGMCLMVPAPFMIAVVEVLR